jgi:hypothetical protein
MAFSCSPLRAVRALPNRRKSAGAGRASKVSSSKSGGDRPRTSAVVVATEEPSFAEVVDMIHAARGRALTAVNTTLIDLYWQVGEFISRRIEMEGWGKGTLEDSCEE